MGDASLTPRQLGDPRAMRALAHPTRLALWEVLTVHGELTATQAAQYVGESPSSCSFHLRQLAKYGFVEEAPRGRGRSRPWRVTDLGFSITAEDPGAEVAAEVLSEVALRLQVNRSRWWARNQRAAPRQWRDFGGQSETVWWVTREEAADLEQELQRLVYRFRGRLRDRASRPEDARPIEFVGLLHPFDILDDADPVDPPDGTRLARDTGTES